MGTRKIIISSSEKSKDGEAKMKREFILNRDDVKDCKKMEFKKPVMMKTAWSDGQGCLKSSKKNHKAIFTNKVVPISQKSTFRTANIIHSSTARCCGNKTHVALIALPHKRIEHPSSNMTPGPLFTKLNKPPRKLVTADEVGTSQSTDTTSEQVEDFAIECLKHHNFYRSKHQVPPLKLSQQLCNYATEWAKHLAKTGKFAHRQNNKYGENIFMNFSSDPNAKISGKDPVESWYNEVKDYKSYDKESSRSGTGHFTQVVWKASTELGIGLAKSKSGTNYVVANYSQAGNVMGQYTNNVLKPVK